jgi:hypothetical protein
LDRIPPQHPAQATAEPPRDAPDQDNTQPQAAPIEQPLAQGAVGGAKPKTKKIVNGAPPAQPFPPTNQRPQDPPPGQERRHLRSTTRTTGVEPEFPPLQPAKKASKKTKKGRKTPPPDVTKDKTPPADGPIGGQQDQRRKSPLVQDEPQRRRNVSENFARRTGMPIVDDFAFSDTSSMPSTDISLPESYVSAVRMDMEPFARWLASPLGDHPDLNAYLARPVRTLTLTDQTRIARFMDVVLNANSEDELYVAIHRTPYVSFLLTDLSRRLQRAYRQGYTPKELNHIRRKIRDIVTSIRMMDQLMTTKCRAAGIPWTAWWDLKGETVQNLLLDLPIPTGPPQPRRQPDQRPSDDTRANPQQQQRGQQLPPTAQHNDTPYPFINQTAAEPTPPGPTHLTTPPIGGAGNMDLHQRPLHPGTTFYTPTKTSTVRLNPEFLRPFSKATRPITDFAEQLRQRRDDLDQMTRFAADEGPGAYPASATYVVPQPPATTMVIKLCRT